MSVRLVVALITSIAILAFAPAQASAARLYVLRDNNQLVTFDTGRTGSVLTTQSISGPSISEFFTSLETDADGTLRLFTHDAVDGSLRMYIVDPETAVATLVTTTPAIGTTASYATAIDPIGGATRIIADNCFNIRLSTVSGNLLASDTTLNQSGVAGVAFSNPVSGTTSSTLFGINHATNQLVTIGGAGGVPSPNGGLISNVGSLGIDVTSSVGFVIAPDGNAYASLVVPPGTTSQLYRIDLQTGDATLVGSIGPEPGLLAVDIAVAPPGIGFAAGPESGHGPIRIFDTDGALQDSFFSFGRTFSGGVDVATGDWNGDGRDDIVVGPSSGRHPVRIFDADGDLMRSFFAFGPRYGSGVNVAFGNFDSDGRDEVVVAPDDGRGKVRIYDQDGRFDRSFFPFGPVFDGGIDVATGDWSGTTGDELVVSRSAGRGGVQIHSATGARLTSFLPFGSAFSGGVTVATGDIDADGRDEVLVGPDSGIGRVRSFDQSRRYRDSFFAFEPRFRGGVMVAAGDIDGDGFDDLIAGAGLGRGPHVRVFDGSATTASPPRLDSFLAYSPGFRGGVNVAAGDFH